MNSITTLIDVLILTTVICFIILVIVTSAELNERLSHLENMVRENKTEEGIVYARYIEKVSSNQFKQDD